MAVFLYIKEGLEISKTYFVRRKLHVMFLTFAILTQSVLVAQLSPLSTRLKITCQLPPIVRDSSDLSVRIVITNISDTVVNVYSELYEGLFDNIFDDSKVNLTIIVERRGAKGFREYSGRSFVDPVPYNDSNFKLVRVAIAPMDSVIKHFGIDDRYTFEIGNYRMMCYYWNNVHVKNPTISNWTYFRVSKRIQVNHVFNKRRT
jgi:hypothetical protein